VDRRNDPLMSPPGARSDTGLDDQPDRDIHIQLLRVADCPRVAELRGLLDRCLVRRGVSARIEETEGPYPSPTLLINDTDVTGGPVAIGPSCRLDLPSEEQILVALARAEGEGLQTYLGKTQDQDTDVRPR
jgi:hypothetical protein